MLNLNALSRLLVLLLILFSFDLHAKVTPQEMAADQLKGKIKEGIVKASKKALINLEKQKH